MNLLIRISFISILFFVLQGCEYLNTINISPKQIKQQSTWNDRDQEPSFNDCEGLKNDANINCFKQIISNNISYALGQRTFISSEKLDQEIVVIIQIDSEGNFLLFEVEDEYDVISKIEFLYSELENIITNLPQALPAIKTNVGIKVKTQLKLPVRIIASSQK